MIGLNLDELVPHLIDGQASQSESARTFEAVDPATGKAIARLAFGEPADVDRAAKAAHAAFVRGDWSKAAPAERAATLRRAADLIRASAAKISGVESLDTGKPIGQALAEVRSAADSMTYFAGHAELPNGQTYPVDRNHFAYSRREPYGVVGAIAPWNYPFTLACHKVAPALVAGNSVVLKMAEQTPLSSILLGQALTDAGIPDGVINVVNGDGAVTGASVVSHPLVSKVSFTGSTATGRAILRAAADGIKSVHVELGGKSPNIVFADADIEAAIDGSLFTSFTNTGQICTSGSRLLVDARIADRFTEALVQRAKALTVGNPRDPAAQLGPLVSREQYSRVREFLEDGERAGAQLLLGSQVDPQPAGGFFISPSIFVGVRPDMRIAQEEIFGPVLSVMTFETEEEAIAIANDVMYGLAATCWTTDLARAFRVAEQIQAGIIWTNCPHFLPVNVPYEGHKASGLGEDMGVEAIREFTRLKTHCLRFGA